MKTSYDVYVKEFSVKEFDVTLAERLEEWAMPAMHYHDAYEIYVLEKGERSYIIDDRLVDLKERDVALIQPYEIHSTAGGGYRRRLVMFRKSYLTKYFTQQATEELLKCFEYKKIHLNGAAYLRLKRALDKLQRAPENFMEFIEVIRVLQESSPQGIIAPVSSGNQMISQIITYIAQNYLEIGSLEEVAERFYISKHYLCRIFKEKTGVSVIQYIHMRKIQDACEMLKTTELSVNEIALNSGFNSSMYFCRTFKNVMGVTPSEYRINASIN